MRVLQIGSDRSQRGDLVAGSAGSARQEAYARAFGALDDISFSLVSDGFAERRSGQLAVYPTNSAAKIFYGLDALRIARRLPRPDVISAQDPFEAGLIAYVIARMQGVPLHVQVHTDLFDPAYHAHSILNTIRVMIARFVLARAGSIRVVSERIKRSIEKHSAFSCPIFVLPIFADVEMLRQAPPHQALAARFSSFNTKLLFVGRLEREKHPCLAVEAFALSAPADACLIIVGTGSERALLEDKVRKLKVAERVFFEGEQAAAPYYSVADLVLVTSRYEGYGLVIVEALASGTPVLSTDVGIAREAGAQVVSGDAFPEALREWFTNGKREGILRDYPYQSFEEYVAAYLKAVRAAQG